MKKIILAIAVCSVILSITSYRLHQSVTTYYYSYDDKIQLTHLREKIQLKFNVSKSQVEPVLKGMSKSVRWTDDYAALVEFHSELSLKQFLESPFAKGNIKSKSKVYVITDSDFEMISSNEIVVKFKKDVSEKKINEVTIQNGLTLSDKTVLYHLFKISDPENVLEVANRIQESGLVVYSFPNFISKIQFHQQLPNDEFFSKQFYLHNTGQVINDNRFGNADADIDAPEAWGITKGISQVVVAVLDDGVSANHPDLPLSRQVRLNGSNPFCGDPNDPEPATYRFHGNASAGIIAASHDNNEGVAGICPNCKIMPVKFTDNGQTPSCTELSLHLKLLTLLCLPLTMEHG